MRSFLKALLVPCITAALAALTLQACSGGENNGSTGAGRCTPGSTQTCTCNGTDMGVQSCNADGASYSMCMCGGGSSSSSSGAGGGGGAGNCHQGMGIPATCGNGMVEGEEECDDGNCNPNDACNNDCKDAYCGDHIVQPPEICDGSENCPSDCGVPSSSSSSSSGMVDPCMGKLVFAGLSAMGDTNGQFIYNGAESYDAAKAACASVNGFGMCDYDQWKQIEMDPVKHAADIAKLALVIPTGTCNKVWLDRRTDLPGMPAGPGGRCNDWKYPTSHLADGEYVDICNNAGTITFNYFLDPDTVYDAANPAPHQNAGLDCSPKRPVPCCFEKCISPPMP